MNQYPRNQEIFRAVDMYPNYEISSHGRLRNSKTGRILIPQLTGAEGNQYLSVKLYSRGVGTNYKIHQLVAFAFCENPENLPCVDHADRDPNNNNYWNLRWATHLLNNMNRTKTTKKPTSSRYKGVYFNKVANKFQAYINSNGQRNHLGLFVNEEDAARHYDISARELYGEFANPNFPI